MRLVRVLEMRAPGIYAKHTDLFQLVDRRAAIIQVAGGFGLTAGPIFSRIGFLLFTDVKSGTIHRWHIPNWESEPRGGKLSVFRENSSRLHGLTFDHQGRLLACETNPGRVTRTEKDGSVTLLADRYQGQLLHSPHDLIYNIDGSVYFTDSPPANSPVATAVYRLPRTQLPGTRPLQLASRECKQARGVALGPQQNLLYTSDAARWNLRVQSIHPDGTLAAGRIFAEFPSDAPGRPDGLTTDEQGNVYSTGPGGVWIFREDGTHLGTIATPEPPTNCCWGRGLQGLYISAQTSIYYVDTNISGTRTF